MSTCCAAFAALLYSDGFTIRGVQKVLKERGLRHVAGIGRGATPDAVVIEKIVIVEKPIVATAETAPAKKRVPHLRAVPSPISLPFFDEPGFDENRARPGKARAWRHPVLPAEERVQAQDPAGGA